MLGVVGPNDFISGPSQLAGGMGDTLEVSFRLRWRFARGQFAQEGNLCEASPKVVMDVLGDAGPIAFNRALSFKLFQLPMQSAHDDLPNTDGNRNERSERDSRPKPPSFVKMSQDFQ